MQEPRIGKDRGCVDAEHWRQPRERTARARALYSLPPEENARLLKLLNGGKTGEGKYVDYTKGANIAGFKKVADAMLAYGVV